MARLKKSTIEQIYNQLAQGPFTTGDFILTFPDQGENLVFIEFRHNPEYNFCIYESTPLGQVLAPKKPTVQERPGEFKTTESKVYDSFDMCIYRISSWTENIKKDLKASIPAFDDFEKLRAEFENYIAGNMTDPERPFNAEQLSAIEKKFAELTERFEELEAKHIVTEEQLEIVREELSEIQASSSQYPKGVWAKLSSSRLAQLSVKLAKTNEARQLMLAAAKKLLGL